MTPDGTCSSMIFFSAIVEAKPIIAPCNCWNGGSCVEAKNGSIICLCPKGTVKFVNIETPQRFAVIVLNFETHILIPDTRNKYSKTCVKRPLMGSSQSGLLRQVVSEERELTFIHFEIFFQDPTPTQDFIPPHKLQIAISLLW